LLVGLSSEAIIRHNPIIISTAGSDHFPVFSIPSPVPLFVIIMLPPEHVFGGFIEMDLSAFGDIKVHPYIIE
jgi:hypothetical protein